MKLTANDNLRALIVEDSDDDVVLLTNVLKDGGFELDFEVVDTRGALNRHVRSGGWDVVFCDHSLPNLDAPNALEIVRKHDRNLPFFIVSGSMTDQMVSQQMHNGAADFFSKADLSRLIPALKRELREARTRQELIRVTTALNHSRLFDAQTGLANAELLRREMLQRIRRGKPFILAVIELSQLRPILKTTGLEWSKSFWSKIGKRISILHENDLPARLSDDVFALLIDRDGDTQEEDVAKSILSEMKLPIRVKGHVLFFTCHIGISKFPECDDEVGRLCERAGIALQWAKESACDYALYQTGLDLAREERIGMARALHQALHNKEFVLHYQPQFDLASGCIVGVEALLRWDRPGYGLVSPASFIPMLEETQLIIPVGEWVMQTASEANRRWQDAGFARIRMAVNLSAIQFRQGGLPALVDDVLKKSGLDPELLELEITESIAMYNEQEIMGTLTALKQRGVLLAIDDFGTGYSSLGYLKRFPIDKLKIDRTFVKDIAENMDDAAIVKAILAMAATLKLDVIAEGVETLAQADYLQAYGCREVQGFYFGKPMPEEQLLQILPAALVAETT